ncbi:MAG: putative membrane protein [Maribacter sp.]|jgi:putative membrane protein
MYIKRNFSIKMVLGFAWKYLLFYAVYGGLVVFAYHWFDHHNPKVNIALPFQPLSVIGIAVAFYVGFKNNQSYDRFWEGRKIWGGIVNYSRTWGNQVLSFVTLKHTDGSISKEELKEIQRRIIYRHIAWFNALRLQLRRPSSFSISYDKKHTSKYYKGNPNGDDWKKDVKPFLSCEEEIEVCKQYKNVATQIIRLQGEELKNFIDNGLIEDFRHMEMMNSLEEFYNLQGKAERIKNTPLPRQYSYFSGVFIWIFVLLMPFGLVGEFASMGHNLIWLTVPMYMLIAWIFVTMEIVGDNSEDPFENFVHDVPMTALCRTIEIDLREMLGEMNIPEKVQAENGILM